MSDSAHLAQIGGIAVAELIKASFESLAKSIGAKISGVYSEIFEDFKPYMNECYKRNRFVRILCQGDDDVDLLSIYVDSTFSSGGKSHASQNVLYDVCETRNVVITGAGGAGKTFFMRRLWLDIFKENQRVPVFLELRKLNDLSTVDIFSFVRASISDKLTDDIFTKFCEAGRFIFIFDGFDELPKALHDAAQAQILRLAEKYNKCRVVVTGRPDERFSGWANFRVYEAEPFNRKQTEELCQKVPFDAEAKGLFLKKLTPSFFQEYHSFLSNPLLTIMMMMTFRRNMNISQKMGIFYDDAFGTLYQWHDSTKAFKRAKNLDIQQFRRSFGAFCLLTYSKEKFDFSRTELDEFIVGSSKIAGITTNKDLILDDYERNVNLIRQDGGRYYFIHRSFQEYFCAWALANIFPHKFAEIAVRIEKRPADAVIRSC